MKRFLFYLFLVLVLAATVLAVADLVNRVLVGRCSGSFAYKMPRLLQGGHEDEIVILGSSRAEGGIVPSELSPKAFNYGMSGCTMYETLFHLEVVLTGKGESPVVVSLEPGGLYGWGFVGDYRYVANDPRVRAESGIELSFVDRLPGLRCQGKFRRNLSAVVNGMVSGTKIIDNGAVLLRQSRSDAEWEFLLSRLESKRVSVDPVLKVRLGGLLSKARRPVVFVVLPVVEEAWRNLEDKGELWELEKWLESYSNVHVFDLQSNGPQFPRHEFVDPFHVNENGARHVTRMVRDMMKERGLL